MGLIACSFIQVRFFYEHIWRAWDLQEECVYYSEALIALRFRLHQVGNENIVKFVT